MCRAPGPECILQPAFDELLSPNNTGSDHGECRAHGAHAAIEHERGAQGIGVANDARVGIQVVVLTGGLAKGTHDTS